MHVSDGRDPDEIKLDDRSLLEADPPYADQLGTDLPAETHDAEMEGRLFGPVWLRAAALGGLVAYFVFELWRTTWK